ncbi:putative sec1 family transport protein [Trypanosoma cruzi]|uniref:Sec1 family transport protein, putative n=2 Tax=Trypanosoma cruzi TaxID=5693 RepID=Q4E2E3_TRYCC|nr:sec1 family transport protein, putative [Trypanosoma cruzi]EAN98933.1 sec1 family transport protein, putative [Trypanosoma cruzi]PWV07838.1 putative sec1 family transport protein [Trypanosoma cruzi]|eukprot:XP_820784.1 sec1 family transport protein [Trypanosoma cruzi strain CL Brener]
MLGQKKHFLRQRQKEVIRAMIASAVPLTQAGGPSVVSRANGGEVTELTVWRLLIYDDIGRDVIAPLLRVGDLRELGITLHMHINSKRDPVPGAPAIYFCSPTEENIRTIASDAVNELYEWVYVNFSSQITRRGLEMLAENLNRGKLQSIQHIHVFDRTLNYVALEDDLFVLMQEDSLVTLNSRHVRDDEVEAHLNAIVLGVSHVLLSQQVLPVIAHSKTGAAEEVARRLSVCLNDHINERTLVPAASTVLSRPLLLIVDRSSDLATVLHHPFSYRGLLVELGDMHLNKVCVREEDGKESAFEIDPDRDEFYEANAIQDFSAVGGNIEAALRQYREEYAALSETACAGEDDTDANAMSRLLASAPKLGEKKRMLDAHTKMAYSFLHHIRKSHLDRFHGVELGIIKREGLDKEEFEKLLLTGLGTVEDRQRLYLIAYLLDTEGEYESLLQRCASAFEETPFPALAYIKHLRNWSLNAVSSTTEESSAAQGFAWGLAQTLAKNIANTLGANAKSELPLTKLVDALLQDPTASPKGGTAARTMGGGSTLRAKLLETVVGYDPRTKKPLDLADTHFSQVIVFTIGGGCVAEYDDLKTWEAAHPRNVVSYGCTALLTGNKALRQLSLLGEGTT